MTDRAAVPAFGADVVRDREIAARLRRFHRLTEHPGSGALGREGHLAEALLLLLERNGTAFRRPGREARAVRRSRGYLREHAGEQVTREDLARYAGLSPFHLSRVFRDAVGMPPHAYQTQVRVRHARSLLRSGRPIEAEVGCYDQARLTRHFKRIVGLTPGRYPR